MRGPGSAPAQRVDLTFHLVTVPVATDRPEEADLFAARLWALGAVGVEEQADRLVGAFDDERPARAAAAALGVDGIEAVADATGLDAWREHATIVEAGPFVVRPPWLEAPVGDLVLTIDPGHSFGSGSHPSTRLALAALADVVTKGDRVLDVGSGSGVLAVAAARLGATVTAVDVDPAAVSATRANADVNGVGDHVEVMTGSEPPGDGYDVVLVNVTLGIHERVAPIVIAAAGDAAAIVVSGVLAGDQERRAADAYGRSPSTRLAEDEWVALVLAAP